MGGSVVLVCASEVNTLGHLRGQASLRAERGADADGRKSGQMGADAVLLVPPNCLVVNDATNTTVGKLVTPGERLVVAEGGVGGEGNGDVWQRNRAERNTRKPPGGATRLRLRLSMTLVADVGLVGYPNAGKSTLLSAVTRARPKVADYPYTTIIPNLGVCELEAFK